MESRRFTERASALMLVPAGILILILLASISVDSAIAFRAQRELQNEAAAAANDVATVAIPNDSDGSGLQNGRGAKPDVVTAQRVASAALLHSHSGGLIVDSVETTVDANVVTITATGHARYIFASAIPGAAHEAHVKVQSSARLEVVE